MDVYISFNCPQKQEWMKKINFNRAIFVEFVWKILFLLFAIAPLRRSNNLSWLNQMISNSWFFSLFLYSTAFTNCWRRIQSHSSVPRTVRKDSECSLSVRSLWGKWSGKSNFIFEELFCTYYVSGKFQFQGKIHSKGLNALTWFVQVNVNEKALLLQGFLRIVKWDIGTDK